MNSRAVALATFVLLVLSRATDLLVTFHFSPSLAREANPVVRIFGGGAKALLVVAVIQLTALGAGLVVYARVRGLPLFAPERLGLRAFAVAWRREVVGVRNRFRNWLPNGSRWRHTVEALRLTSVALSWSLIFGSFNAVGAWFALFANDDSGWKWIFSRTAIASTLTLPYLFAILGFTFGAGLFFYSEHSRAASRAVTPQRVKRNAK